MENHLKVGRGGIFFYIELLGVCPGGGTSI